MGKTQENQITPQMTKTITLNTISTEGVGGAFLKVYQKSSKQG